MSARAHKGLCVRLFGDTAALVEVGGYQEAHQLAREVRRLLGDRPGVEEVVTGFASVTVIVDPAVVGPDELTQWFEEVEPRRHFSNKSAAAGRSGADEGVKEIRIPVLFDGPDLGDVAAAAACGPDDVKQMLLRAELVVAFVGFAPGFGYLVGLPPQLRAIERRSVPRPRVPAGSVALAGGFAGVYPQSTPGGWHLVGHTTVTLFDPSMQPHALLSPGDRVRFVPAVHDKRSEPVVVGLWDKTSAHDLTDEPSQAHHAQLLGNQAIVERAAGWAALEDAGRLGVAAIGVPRSGAADDLAMETANRLVGNSLTSPVLETAFGTVALRFTAPTHVAVLGDVEVTIDDLPVPTCAVVPISAGQILALGAPASGVRSTLAVSGGFRAPLTFGSTSTDMLCGLGPGPVWRGQALGIGPPARPRGRLVEPVSALWPSHRAGLNSTVVLRVMQGPDDLAGLTEALVERTWEVSPTSDRVGVRLRGDALIPALRSRPHSGSGTKSTTEIARVDPKAMVHGAIQLPPSGEPIVLGRDHATVGGYRVVATVISADRWLIGQLRPGNIVRFEQVDAAEAAQAWRARTRYLERAVAGWFPTWPA